MKTSLEINKAVNNIKYYANQVEELSRKQLAEDMSMGYQRGINVDAGTVRFESLGRIGEDAGGIKIYCDNILRNVKTADEQDNKLFQLGE